MSLVKTAKHSLRTVLEAAGYWVRHRSVLPFGIDYQLDIQRMADLMGIPVGTFFDIGAHTGETSLDVLRKFPGVRIFAFEAHPTTFSVLISNVHDARFDGFNIALSDKNGKAQFYEYGYLATCNSLVGDNQFAVQSKNPSKVLEVECQTLDGFCGAHGIEKIDVLKIDTEGHDLSVLRGAEQTLAARGVSFVYIEFNSMLPRPGTTGGALMPITAILEPLGFHFVASYPECMITTGELLVTSNALFVRPPSRSAPHS
ncbi:MAG TPA: FkbM family methyltransferase [Rhizomicrobium sp.]